MEGLNWLFFGALLGFAIAKVWDDVSDSLKRFKSWRIRRGRS